MTKNKRERDGQTDRRTETERQMRDRDERQRDGQPERGVGGGRVGRAKESVRRR